MEEASYTEAAIKKVMLEHGKFGHINPTAPLATQSGPPRSQVTSHRSVSKRNQSIFNFGPMSRTSSATSSFISAPPEMETPAPASSPSKPSSDNQPANVEKEWEEYKAWASTAAHTGDQFSVTWLLDLWKSKQHRFRNLYKIALSIIAMPASAVPSEEAFSGGRRTCSLERNALGPELISCLQIIKSFLVSRDQREEKDFWAHSAFWVEQRTQEEDPE